MFQELETKWEVPAARKRCEWVVEQTDVRDRHKPPEVLKGEYAIYTSSVNNFYRGTAHLFWHDFVNNGWGNFDLSDLGITTTLADGSPIERTSTWTWIMGDQHLSNFGAWRNRHGDIVFGVNDFDESTIFDFQMDIWRLAVSIYNHALSNDLGEAKAEAAVLTFTNTYVRTIMDYVNNDRAETFEINQDTSKGKLTKFLSDVDSKRAQHLQIKRYTEVGKGGQRRFIKDKDTNLEPVTDEEEKSIRDAFTRLRYGATMQKVGWRVKKWKDADFAVLDVARRVESGVGSYGVQRYYVLLAGDDALLEESGGVILDVKQQPTPSVRRVLDEDDLAWYQTMFNDNEAMRVVEAQRQLTSYTDPYVGWVELNNSAFAVRQRSPWKASMDLGVLNTYAEFAQFVTQIAVITATSHTRGSVGKAPGTFKEVIHAALGPQYARATWGVSVSMVAAAYRKQVQEDFECFREYVDSLRAVPSVTAELMANSTS